jgi:hypothetical protein
VLMPAPVNNTTRSAVSMRRESSSRSSFMGFSRVGVGWDNGRRERMGGFRVGDGREPRWLVGDKSIGMDCAAIVAPRATGLKSAVANFASG